MKIVFKTFEYEVDNFNYSKSQNSFNAKCKLPTDFVIGTVATLEVWDDTTLVASHPAMTFTEENNNYYTQTPTGTVGQINTQVFFKGVSTNLLTAAP